MLRAIEVLFKPHSRDPIGSVIYEFDKAPWKDGRLVGIPRTGLYIWEWQYACDRVLNHGYPRTREWLEGMSLPIVLLDIESEPFMGSFADMIEINEIF